MTSQINNWPEQFVHYRKVDQETLSDPVAPTGVHGGEEPPSVDEPLSVAADLDQADVDTEGTVTPVQSCSTHPLIDKVPVCMSLHISGSGAQPLPMHVMKAALLVLSHPTFSLSRVRETEKFQLLPATRNLDLGVPTGLLLLEYTGRLPVVPKSVAQKEVGFKIASKGTLCSLCDVFTNLTSLTF